tara:strand:+ start:7040 stop:7732 length:693 start_codon:yes stop_codon:yes gene_type:complete
LNRLLTNADARLIAFDLDGTLIDSVPDLSKAIQKTLGELDLPEQSQQQVRSWVGDGARMLVKRALSGDIRAQVPEALFNKAYPLFLRHYAKHLNCESTLYDGVGQTLQGLKEAGIKLACITNKPTQFTLPLLEQFGLSDFFEKVVCGDTFEQRKPHPQPLLEVADFFKTTPQQAIMVGDSINDIQAAQAAGFYSICVDYGYHGDHDVNDLGADLVISHFSQINRVITRAA